MKRLLIIALLLAGCTAEPQLTTTRHIVVTPDESMYTCQKFNNWPDTSRLTAVQVSRTIVELYTLNEQCYNSQQALRRFLEEARNRPAQ